ncbi:hypothetical protein [Cellvibrio sp. OA-2007]
MMNFIIHKDELIGADINVLKGAAQAEKYVNGNQTYTFWCVFRLFYAPK